MTQATETLQKEIFIECRPETLFPFFIDPDKMIRWMGRQVLLEPKIGGKYRIDINGENIAIGEYKEIVENEKVVLTWGWEGSSIMPPGSSTVEFIMEPKDNGTLLILNHLEIPSEKLTSNNNGWTHYLQRIKQLGEGKDLGTDPWSITK
ncbi:SRPBCC family protein [Pseudalkalibacillus berkeleyi]|uniref:SRPBCC domain-containing protein n=1 Tax=Pseudalkalibacillus berkeleyi TaxID=1069813 RepID=A0ABS9H268_9BACL|nr:SRPBCC family protein [Pseudalkalibacillus berkeleyi]MCF6139047.1 SRPBCC domain-containing protein [Pseudalkalibacillus berkeleyi]